MDTIKIFDTTLRDGEQSPGFSMNLNEKFFIGIGSGGEPDLEITLNSVENEQAEIFLKTYQEQEFVGGNYKELFDIVVELVDDEIEDSSELSVYMKFINFGEGASKIEIIYSIFNWEGEEVYRGIDEKVVYTEESIVKNFDFLELGVGKYTIKSQIFYGENQTAVSERSFEIINRSFFSQILIFLVFIGLILGVYFFLKASIKVKKE